MTVFKFSLKRVFSKKINRGLLLILPIIFALLPSNDYNILPIGFYIYGAIIMVLSVKLTAIIMEDRNHKTLLRIIMSPTPNFRYLLESFLAFILLITISNIIFVTIGFIIHQDALISPMGLLLIYTIFSVTFIAFGLGFYSLFKKQEIAMTLIFIIIIFMSLFGGILLSTSLMPLAMQRFAMIFPTFYLMEAIGVITSNSSLVNLIFPLVILVLYSVVFLLVGSR